MKNTLKRTLSLVLTVCMLLSVLPFAAFAETYTPSQLLTMYQNGGSKAAGGGVKVATGGYFQKQFSANTEIDYVGILFENIAPGVYTLDIALNTANKASSNVAVVSKDAVDATSGNTTNLNNLLTDENVGNFAVGATPSYSVTLAGDSNNAYYVFFQQDQETKKFLCIDSITLTKDADAYALNGDTALTSEQEVIDALAASGSTVKLLRDINVGGNATLAADSTLNLNGYTLSGTIATLGTVTGTGTISEKPMNVAPGYVALENNGVYDVVKYSVKKDNTAVADGNNVNFWFRVELGADYALAKNDADFKIGVNVTVGEASADAEFSDELINAWADAMVGENADAVTFRVTIKNAADLSLDLCPTVGGNAVSAISYAPAA